MKAILTFFILLTIGVSFGQKTKFDSLLVRLQSETDRQKIETYLDISETDISTDISLKYLSEGLKLAKKIDFDSLYTFYKFISIDNYYLGKFSEALVYLDSSNNYLDYTKDPIDYTALNLNLKGSYYLALNKLDSAKYFHQKALKIIENEMTENSNKTRASIKTNLATLFLLQANYNEAIPLFLESSAISEKYQDFENSIVSLNNVATCFKELKDFDEALLYLEKAEKLNTVFNSRYFKEMINVGKGELFALKGDTIKGIRLLEKTIISLKEAGHFKGLSTAYLALTEVYEKQNNPKALEASFMTINLLNEFENYFDRASILITNAKLNLRQGNYSAALKSIKKAKVITIEYNYLDLLVETLEVEIEIYGLTKNNGKLLASYDDFFKAKEELMSSEKIKIIQEANTKYQTTEKENEILKLKEADIQKTLALEKEKSRKLTFASLFGLGIVSLGGFVYYARNRRKRLLDLNRFQIVEAKQKEHQRIGADLHDSKAKTLEKIAMALDENGNSEIADRIRGVKENIRVLSHELLQMPFAQEEFDEQIITLFYEYNSAELNIVHEGIREIEWKTIDDTIKRNLYLVINEAISNSKNHSGASEAKIKFEKKGKQLAIYITDNGRGYKDSDLKNGFGFSNMKMRIHEINGTIRFDSIQNKGSEIGIFLSTF